MKKRLFINVITFVILSSPMGTISAQAASLPSSPSENTSYITPRAVKIEWRYKKMNGKHYKRQYNVTKNVWIGNWIRV